MFGFVVVLIAAGFFCIQNVIVRILFVPQNLFGVFPTGGFVEPTLYNSFLLMAMRMVVVVPLMAGLSSALYQPMWKDVQRLSDRAMGRSLVHAIGSGGLMFLYLALLYFAIGLIPTGIALTLFFTYPCFTAVVGWWLRGDRPSTFRWLIMAGILIGTALTVPFGDLQTSNIAWGAGISLGLTAGLAQALYTVNAQKGMEQIHPMPFTWVTFAVALGISALCVGLWPVQDAPPLSWTPLWIGGVASAVVTFAGHLLNNYGIRQIGATPAAMIGASNPTLTVILAWIAIQEMPSVVQLCGVLLVTLCVVALSWVR